TGTGVQQESRRPSSPWKPRLSRAESHSAIREGWSTGGALDALFAARCLLWTGPGGEGFPPCSRRAWCGLQASCREPRGLAARAAIIADPVPPPAVLAPCPLPSPARAPCI